MFWFLTIPAISNQILITFSVLILHFVYNGNAIKCFVCDSTDNPSCTDVKSNSSLIAEECTLENMKSIDSWLFALNELAFYPTGVYSNPLFNCQKVVAREPGRNRVVTARFCQLHTADSDACKILQNKMFKQESARLAGNGYNNRGGGGADLTSTGRRNNYANPGYDNNGDDESNKDRLMHCSICSEDRCNGAMEHLPGSKSMGLFLLSALMMKQLRFC